MRIPIIAGNWKMNKTMSEAMALVQTLQQELGPMRAIKSQELVTEIIIAPPYTVISKIADFLKGSFIKISAQDLFWEDAGAFTGAISAPLLKDIGVTHIIIGHSERRQYFHETDETVNKKIKAALKHDLVPIFCVGETLTEREEGKMGEVITTQLLAGLAGITQKEITKTIIAYEPVWAIGTGKTATPEQAEEVHLMIRTILARQFGEMYAAMIRILYGGSVKPSNSAELLAKPNIDGALVGGASLQAKDFIGIVQGVGIGKKIL